MSKLIKNKFTNRLAYIGINLYVLALFTNLCKCKSAPMLWSSTQVSSAKLDKLVKTKF